MSSSIWQIEARSLAEPQARAFCSSGQPVCTRGSLCFPCAGITGGLPHPPGFNVGFEETDSGPSIYMAVGFSAKPSPRPQYILQCHLSTPASISHDVQVTEHLMPIHRWTNLDSYSAALSNGLKSRVLGETAKWLKARAAPLEDPGLIPSTHMAFHSCPDGSRSRDSLQQECMWCTYVCKQAKYPYTLNR